MKILLPALLLAVVAPSLFADSIVCTFNSAVIPCATSALSITSLLPSLSVAGNTITISTNVGFDGFGSGASRNAVSTATATVNDAFPLPSSPAGDVFQVLALYGADQYNADPGSNVTFSFQIGPGSSSAPQVSLNPFIQPPASCPPGATQACIYSGTLPASIFSFFAVQGTETLVANGDNGGGDSYVFFDELTTVSRFKADGVTPDPFTTTPEPAALGLLLLGGATLTLYIRRQRRTY